MTPTERYECARVARDAIGALCFPTHYEGEEIPNELYPLYEQLRNIERMYQAALAKVREVA